MLKSILDLSQIGKLDSQTIAALQFTKFTVVYGANGSGKSTLAAVLRSLALNRPDDLLGRRSLGSKLPIQAHVQGTQADYHFENDHWDQSLNQLAVFDQNFINENVHSGQIIQSEHRRHLFDFILGEQAVTFSAQIEAIDQQLKALNQQLKDCEQAPFLRQMMKMEAFAKLDGSDLLAVQDIQMQRQRMSQHLAVFKAHRSLPEFKSLDALHPPKLDWQQIQTQLSNDLSSLHNSAQQRVEDWLKNLGPQAESWLAQGLQHAQHLSDRSCPFCAQSLQSSDLVKNYAEYFNQAYQQQDAELGAQIEFFKQLLPDSLLIQWQTQLQSNQNRYQSWSDFGDLSPYEALDLSEIWLNMKSISVQLMDLLLVKQRGLKDVHFDAQLQQSWEQELQKLRLYYQQVQNLNKELLTLSQHWQSEDQQRQTQISELENELALLDLQLFRQSSTAAQAILNWQDLLLQKDALQAQKDDLRQQLKDTLNKVLSQCMLRLNKYLYRLKTGLRLIGLKETHIGGKASINYAFQQIGGNKISLDAPKEPGPYWSTVLSDADQQCLGLAFFLAQAEAHAKQILVFDDPTVGLDSERFDAFCECLEDLQDQLEQIIIFSHQHLDFSRFEPVEFELKTEVKMNS